MRITGEALDWERLLLCDRAVIHLDVTTRGELSQGFWRSVPNPGLVSNLRTAGPLFPTTECVPPVTFYRWYYLSRYSTGFLSRDPQRKATMMQQGPGSC